MSETSRISITDQVHKRIGAVMRAFRTAAAKDKARKDFLKFRSNEVSDPKGKEARKPKHRMYLQNEDYLPQHGKIGENIIK